jgi:hypothetical protein
MMVMRYLASIAGVPSITSIVLLLDLATSRAGRPLFFASERRILLFAIAAASLVLYPSSLGYSGIDVYRLGFSASAPLVIAALGVWSALRRELRVASLALVILIALDLQLLPSANAFDYVLDPIVGIIAIVYACTRLMTIITHA